MARLCAGCGKPFTASDPRKTYCRKGCGRSSASSHAARTVARDAHTITFAGVDGEGVTGPDGRHDYVMLSVANQTLDRGGAPLSTADILQHLWDTRDLADAHTGFYLGYDYTQWVKGLPENTARELVTDAGMKSRLRTRSGGNPVPFPVRWGGWEFDLLAGRRFKLRPAGTKEWHYVCDAGPFYQCGFASAIDPHEWTEPIATDTEVDVIREGKRRRADAGYGPEMITYNVTENAVMSKLMATLNSGLVRMGVRLGKDQWFGPGQAAGVWLVGRAPDSRTIRDNIADEILAAARASFFGGWFEIFAHGPVGTLHERDLNSAYPHAIAGLPCLLHGQWEHRPPREGEFGLLHASVGGSSPLIGAMLHREPDGTIHRPRTTAGWYWRHELDAARRAGCVDRIDVDAGYTYRPCSCPPPLADIAHLYQLRLDVGKNSVQGKTAKLVYNSCFGKLAQSVGNPRWANPIYASLITSLTRTSILDAIAHTEHQNVAMIATDGIYTFDPIPGLDCSPTRLGAWDSATKDDVTLLMPGIYWDSVSRERLATGQSLKLASRGVSAVALAHGIGSLDDQWRAWRPGQPWPAEAVPLPFSMVSARQALARGKWHTAGTIIPHDTKRLSGDPKSKRDPGTVWIDPAGRVRTLNYAHGSAPESVPYDGTLGAPPDPMTPDGPVSTVIGDMLR